MNFIYMFSPFDSAKVDIASDGLVDWDEFCTYLMLQFEENDQAAKVNGSTFSPKPNIVRIDYNKVHYCF